MEPEVTLRPYACESHDLAQCLASARYVAEDLRFLNFMHTVAASGFGVGLGLILATLPWTMPFQLREFLYASYVLLGLVLLVLIFRVAGQISLVGMQIAATMLGTFWIILFVRNTKLVVDRLEAQPGGQLPADLLPADLLPAAHAAMSAKP